MSGFGNYDIPQAKSSRGLVKGITDMGAEEIPSVDQPTWYRRTTASVRSHNEPLLPKGCRKFKDGSNFPAMDGRSRQTNAGWQNAEATDEGLTESQSQIMERTALRWRTIAGWKLHADDA